MRVTKAVGWASVVAALFVAANDAHASCTSPLPGLLWSNPTLDGGHVPRDGVLWLLSTTGGFDSIEIDGSEITAPEAAWLPISLEGLEPGEHTISLMQLNHFVGEPLHLDGVFTIKLGFFDLAFTIKLGCFGHSSGR